MDALRNNSHFQRVYRKGRYKVGRYIVMYILPNRTGINRIGITTGRKFGNSVQRNRMKRLIREAYRSIEDSVTVGYDIVFMARASERKSNTPNNKLKAVYVPSYKEVSKEIIRLSSALGMII